MKALNKFLNEQESFKKMEKFMGTPQEYAAKFMKRYTIKKAIENANMIKGSFERNHFDSNSEFKEHQDYWDAVIKIITNHI